MIRVGFAVGSWQLISLAAALDAAGSAGPPGESYEDHVVLYETGAVSAGLKAAMHDVAAAVRPWHRVVDAFELFADVPRKPSQPELDALIAGLRAFLGLDRIDELWLCWLTRPAEKLILEAWPEARVLLYEDGLTSYLPPARPMRGESPLERVLARARLPFLGRLEASRPARRFSRHRSSIDPRHLQRVEAAWMLLADCWPPPPPLDRVPWHLVASDAVAARLEACQAIPSVAGFEPRPGSRPAVLVLGQMLSRWKALSRADELALYTRAIELTLVRGYDVWWKEHPRARVPFFPDLVQRFSPERVRALDLPFALPVELVADRLGLVACIAGMSAALYYLERWCGVAGYTFADALMPHVSGAWALQNSMVRQTMPALQELPDAANARSDPGRG